MDTTRRNLILNTLFGAGSIGLRALATGLPISLLARPHTARADENEFEPSPLAQFLVFITSSSGDPLNANVPGTYAGGPLAPIGAGGKEVYHAPANINDGSMVGVNFSLDGTQVRGARAWSRMPQEMLDHTCFFHHGTYTNAHGDAPKVNRLMGAVRQQEMLVSMLAKNLAPHLNTVQQSPIVLSTTLVVASGQVQPVLNPPALRDVLAAPASSPLRDLRTLRDQHLDRMNALFKENGRKSDIKLLDRYALSQREVRSISEELLGELSSITGSTPADLNRAATILFAMRVTPAVVFRYAFGGDNHNDQNLSNEATQTTTSVNNLVALRESLSNFRFGNEALDQRTTIALQNVFGRTLCVDIRGANTTNGRDHNPNHHCSVFIGPHIKGSQIGRLEFSQRDFKATSISSSAGTIPFNDTLGAAGKTLGRALGLKDDILDEQIQRGRAVPEALRPAVS